MADRHGDDTTSVHALLKGDEQSGAEFLKIMRHLSERQNEMADDVGDIKEALASGSPVIEAVRALPVAFAVVQAEVATLKALVYGAVGLCLVGVIGMAGTAMVFFIRNSHP